MARDDTSFHRNFRRAARYHDSIA